jgi:hypothetical protein
MMHLRLACYRGEELLYVRGHRTVSALDTAAELTAELALEVHEAAEAEESVDVLVAVEGAEHAGEVVGGGDPGAEAVSERFAGGAAAQVVPAARAAACARPWQGHTPIIDTRHDGEHPSTSRNATAALVHETQTHPSDPQRLLADLPLAQRDGDTIPRFRVGHWVSVGRAATRCSDNLDAATLRLSACHGQGRPQRSRLRVPNSTVSEGLHTACTPRMCSRPETLRQAHVCVGCVPGGDGRISARAQAFRVMTCVDERCRCLAREQTWIFSGRKSPSR